jgi:hypothetical protein
MKHLSYALFAIVLLFVSFGAFSQNEVIVKVQLEYPKDNPDYDFDYKLCHADSTICGGGFMISNSGVMTIKTLETGRSYFLLFYPKQEQSNPAEKVYEVPQSQLNGSITGVRMGQGGDCFKKVEHIDESTTRVDFTIPADYDSDNKAWTSLSAGRQLPVFTIPPVKLK